MVFNLGVILVMPVFVGTLTYLFLDHRYARTGFGGNEGILDWVGWIFTQPATFLFAIPAIGMLVEIFPITFGKRTPARGVMFAGLSLLGLAALAEPDSRPGDALRAAYRGILCSPPFLTVVSSLVLAAMRSF